MEASTDYSALETVSASKFGEMMGISHHKALDLCHSAMRPPGFFCGRNYRVAVGSDAFKVWFDDFVSAGGRAARIA